MTLAAATQLQGNVAPLKVQLHVKFDFSRVMKYTSKGREEIEAKLKFEKLDEIRLTG